MTASSPIAEDQRIRLARWFHNRDQILDDDPIERFAGGVANANFKISVDGAPIVLRRAPGSAIAQGTNDLLRERATLLTLEGHFHLAPRSLGYCDELDVLGAPFHLLEFREGIPVGAQMPAMWGNVADAPREVAASAIDAMILLHRVDPYEVRVGRPDLAKQFLNRQVDSWIRRGNAAFAGPEIGLVEEIGTWLRRRAPVTNADDVAILHGDLKPDNILFDIETRRPSAVIDWDLAASGHHLFDLGVLLAYWMQPGDPPDALGLDQVPSLNVGSPSRAALAETYLSAAACSGADLTFFLLLGRFRLAVAWQQLDLHRKRESSGVNGTSFAQIAHAVLRWTAQACRGASRNTDWRTL